MIEDSLIEIKKDIFNRVQNGADFMDAILECCQRFNREIEAVGEMVRKDPELMAGIRADARSLNLLKGNFSKLS